ncbi:MAG: LAGLIDADG family homing endonuclease [Polyangiales bacterium]
MMGSKHAEETPRAVDVARAWSEADDAAIVRMRAQGLTGREIATRLGRAPGSTGQRIHRLRQRGELPYLTRAERLRAQARIRAVRTEEDRTMAQQIFSSQSTSQAVEARDAHGRVTRLHNTKDLGYVVGVLYGDAYVHQSRLSLALRCRDPSFAGSFAIAVSSALTRNVKVLSRIEPIKRVGAHVYRNLEYHEVWVHDRHLVAALQRWTGPTTTREWEIRLNDAMARGAEYCDGVIQGLFDSDGSISVDGRDIRFGTASERGARSLLELLSWRGYVATLYPVSKKGEHRIRLKARSVVRYAYEISSRIDAKRTRLRALL